MGITTVDDGGNDRGEQQACPTAQEAGCGKLLEWKDISMTVKTKSKEQEKKILDQVWGMAKPGETTAVLGASGAGKTSLFRILAGRLRTNSRISVTGQVYLSRQLIDPSSQADLPVVRSLFAYVAQQDTLHESSTPREALTFSARLRGDNDHDDDAATMTVVVDVKVRALLQQLGLASCADQKISSLSGGERRRTSIGIELVSADYRTPSIVFADEPTSGLDSFAARRVLRLLRDVALAGNNTVLFTIHQPSSDVFRSFDRLLLLHRGRTMYQGLARDAAADFARLGYGVPDSHSTAEWLLDVAQSETFETLKSHGFFRSRKPEEDRFDDSSGCAAGEFEATECHHRASCCTAVKMLLLREKNSLIRSPGPTIANVGATAFLSIVFGAFFLGVGRKNRADLLVIQAVLGALVNILISIMMSQAQNAATIFSKERGLFLREYATNHYTIPPYFISKLFAEAFQSFVAMLTQSVISYFMIGFQMNFFIFFLLLYSTCMTSTAVSVLLGCICDNPQVAFALSLLVSVPQFYFSGVFIATNLIPTWIRWAQWLCFLKYSAGLAFMYEFEYCKGEPVLLSVENCDRILVQNNVNPDDRWWYWLAMVSIFGVFRLVALVVLRHKGSSFA